MCVPNSPLFQRCQVYDWPPFFNKKYINGPIFLDSYVKDPIFLTSWYMHIFFVQRFFEAAYPLGITWIDYDICVITSKKWVQKIKGQYMNRSTFWMIKYMNGSVFSKARYMNGVGFEILARTPVPKLPLSYPPPPPPHPPPVPPPTPSSCWTFDPVADGSEEEGILVNAVKAGRVCRPLLCVYHQVTGWHNRQCQLISVEACTAW